MSAIAGTFVSIQQVASRKVVRLAIEVPVERANEALGALGGFPDPANPVWVGVARLVAQPPAPEPKEPRRMEQLHGGSQAALICKREAFWRFLREQRGQDYCDSEKEAAAIVRSFCEVKSRSEIEMNEGAKQRWNLLYSAFLKWMKEPVP